MLIFSGLFLLIMIPVASAFYSFDNYAFSHIGDFSDIILLMTSKKLSQKILKNNWKRVQKLAYVYFYSGAIYEFFFLYYTFAFYALVIVTEMTFFAWEIKKHREKMLLDKMNFVCYN